MFGPQIFMRGFTGRVCYPDDPNQEVEWHFHQNLIPDPLPRWFSRPQTMDALLYLDDLTDLNGPLCVLPGSHRHIGEDLSTGRFDDLSGQVVLQVPAGSVVMFHGSLWHRALPTRPGGTMRRLLIMGIGPAWMKGSIYGKMPENGLTRPLRQDGDAETRELLGAAGFNSSGRRRVSHLHDAPYQWRRGAGDPARVARAVPALMMVGHRAYHCRIIHHAADDRHPVRHVLLDDGILLAVKRPGLRKTRSGTATFPISCSGPATANTRCAWRPQSQGARQQERPACHVFGVLACIAILGIYCIHQSFQDPEGTVAQQILRVAEPGTCRTALGRVHRVIRLRQAIRAGFGHGQENRQRPWRVPLEGSPPASVAAARVRPPRGARRPPGFGRVRPAVRGARIRPRRSVPRHRLGDRASPQDRRPPPAAPRRPARWPVGIVEELEVVDIHQQQRTGARRRRGARIESRWSAPVVSQTRQRVPFGTEAASA